LEHDKGGQQRRELLCDNDNASLHTARTTEELLQSLNWKVLAHSSHSPDPAASDYCLFSEVKESLAGRIFSDDDEVQDAVMTWLRGQAGDFYDTGIKKLVSRLTKCIAVHGHFVEK
jgi:hypothetical protein